jgi:hypothetical protein
MGAVCSSLPPDNGEVEYFGPPDRSRNLPSDLKVWRKALEEKKERDRLQPKQVPSSSEQKIAGKESSQPQDQARSSYTSNASAIEGGGLVTPGGSKIENIKDDDALSHQNPSSALAVI